ncbi:MAG: hypothetical protein ACQEUN_16300 [Pseudomonadota bacterium]
MSARKKAKREFKTVYEVYELDVISFDVRMSAGVNAMPETAAFYTTPDTPLYDSCMEVEIRTTTLAPKRFRGEVCTVNMRSSGRDEQWATLRVADVQRNDENGRPRYFERGRDLIPDFESPHSIGYVNSTRGNGTRYAHVSVPFDVVQEFRAALSLGQAPRIFMNVRRKGFGRAILRVAYSTPGLFEY